MLLDRDPNKIHNNADFTEAVHLYYDKASVSLRSLKHQLLALTQSTVVHLLRQQKLMMQIEPVIFLAPHAHVMLTANL